MPDRYWVGGTANWDGTAGTKWSATSGGAGGASEPTAADDVFFNAASGAVTVTVTAVVFCRNLTTTGFTGTFAGSSNIRIDGSLTLNAGVTFTHTGTLQFTAASGSYTITTAGKTVGAVSLAPLALSTATWTLQDALTTSGQITVTYGTFTTNNFNVTATQLSSNNSNTRTINLGSSTVTLSITGAAVNFSTQTNLTFNAGTSTVTMSGSSPAIVAGVGVTFHNVSFTNTLLSTPSIQGVNVFNNLTLAGRTSAGVASLRIDANQTINGTLTLSAGTNATMRTFVFSNTIGTTRTLTCAAVASLTDIDFRDITIAGAAAPVSGTRLGDCKGNSGITFPAGKTVYWSSAGATWSTTAWSDTPGGFPNVIYFPLAQDIAIFSSSPGTGQTVSINNNWNIGTIDMSARTSNTMTLATSTNTPTIYGNWINGTGTTLTGTGTLTFAGRGSQTITSAGRTFTQAFVVDTPGGSVTLQDAFETSRSVSLAFTFTSGTLDANGYNFTLSGATSGFQSSVGNTRTLAIGSGTWTLAGTGNWNVPTITNLTITGTGTISLTSASAKTFNGGGAQTYPTLNQGGTGTLTITGSNKFADITDTAIGRVQFTGGTTNIFTAFNLSGTAGNLLQLGSTNTTQATLQKSSTWFMGANSTDGGNNTGLTFTAGGGIDYLSVSYINGTVVAPFISASILESATANSTEASLVTFNASASELASGSDSILGGLIYLGVLSESATAADIASVIDVILAAINESASAQDIASVVASAFNAAAAEIAAAQDSAQAAATFPTALSESTQISDANSAALNAGAAVSESAAASDSGSSLAVFGGEIAELAAGLDAALVVASVFSATASEIAQAQDLLDAPGSVYNAAMSESALSSDSILGAYLWNPIDDTQNPNWQNINNAQSVTWTTVTDTQNPGWVIIPTSND